MTFLNAGEALLVGARRGPGRRKGGDKSGCKATPFSSGFTGLCGR